MILKIDEVFPYLSEGKEIYKVTFKTDLTKEQYLQMVKESKSFEIEFKHEWLIMINNYNLDYDEVLSLILSELLNKGYPLSLALITLGCSLIVIEQLIKGWLKMEEETLLHQTSEEDKSYEYDTREQSHRQEDEEDDEPDTEPEYDF